MNFSTSTAMHRRTKPPEDRSPRIVRPLVLATVFLASISCVFGGSISEPATVFYGKVLSQSGNSEQLIVSGTLTWTIEDAEENRVFELQTVLEPLAGGEYSYRLDVPHQALSLGLEATGEALAIGQAARDVTHLQIHVDGEPAAIRSPGSHGFDVEAASRAATYRLDLLVTLPSEDSDGDGMPDWWEDAHGLDSQRDDRDGDADGDGLSNLAEFMAGSDPSRDNRRPELATSEIFVYPGASNGVLLKTLDSDSTPDQLSFLITRTPSVGSLVLRNTNPDPSDPNTDLPVGSRFTQADVDAGRLLYLPGSDETSLPEGLSFELVVTDEDLSHSSAPGEVAIRSYEAPFEVFDAALIAAVLDSAPLPRTTVSRGEESRLRNAVLGREHGFVVWDLSAAASGQSLAQPSSDLDGDSYSGSYMEEFGPDRRHIVTGGVGDDSLAGGMEDDILIGGAGSDTFRGAGGADRFLLMGADDGNDILADFSPGEGDVIDLTRVLDGESMHLGDYLSITHDGTDTTIGLDVDGDGSGFDDIIMTLEGSQLASSDLPALVANHNILAPGLSLPPQVSIAATLAMASENGPEAGQFTVSRIGSIEVPLTVGLSVSGSASNGVDYSLVGSSVLIPAGESSVDIAITPFVDTLTELTEVVEIAIAESGGYELGDESRAQVSISDLQPELGITTLVPLAVSDTGQPGVFLISRTGVIDRSVLVRFSISGSAAPGHDYETLPAFLNMPPGQTSALVQITPSQGGSVSNGAESVILSIDADAAYRTSEFTTARVTLIEAELDLEGWRGRHFPEDEGTLSDFAASDPEGSGMPMLLRYGFGLAPSIPLPAPAASLPRAEVRDGRLTISFHRMPAITDLEYRVEVSDDLRSWSSDPALITDVTPADRLDPRATVYRATRRESRFMRVRLIQTVTP